MCDLCRYKEALERLHFRIEQSRMELTLDRHQQVMEAQKLASAELLEVFKLQELAVALVKKENQGIDFPSVHIN